VRIEIGNHEGFRRFRHDVLQEVAIVIGHGIFFVEKEFHALRTALEGDDKDIRLFAAAFDEMALIRLCETILYAQNRQSPERAKNCADTLSGAGQGFEDPHRQV